MKAQRESVKARALPPLKNRRGLERVAPAIFKNNKEEVPNG